MLAGITLWACRWANNMLLSIFSQGLLLQRPKLTVPAHFLRSSGICLLILKAGMESLHAKDCSKQWPKQSMKSTGYFCTGPTKSTSLNGTPWGKRLTKETQKPLVKDPQSKCGGGNNHPALKSPAGQLCKATHRCGGISWVHRWRWLMHQHILQRVGTTVSSHKCPDNWNLYLISRKPNSTHPWLASKETRFKNCSFLDFPIR